MNRRFIDWIWHVRGSLPLAPGQSGEEAFRRLTPLFNETGTTHERTTDTLTFRKKDPAAQDKMAVFENGVLQIERGPTGPVLRYHLTSRILLFCFLAPLIFLAFGQLTVIVGDLETPSSEVAGKPKKDDQKDKVLPQNPIDKALGAPAPEKPKKDDPNKSDEDTKPSPTAAYVFAGIFAVLYLIGRVLEERLVKRLFGKRLTGSAAPSASSERDGPPLGNGTATR